MHVPLAGVVQNNSVKGTWNMFNHAPIVAAARGTGLFNMTNNFNASALISVTLFCHEDGFNN
jgi:capsular polysaccharide biosynthesis protein